MKTRPQPPNSQDTKKKQSIAITIIDQQILCRPNPDLLVASNALSRSKVYNRGKATKATCWSEPSIRGGPEPDTKWLKTDDGCFIRERDQTGGELTKLVLERCEDGPKHWVGLLKLDQQPYCYDEPTIESATHKQEPTAQQAVWASPHPQTGAMYLDLGCMVSGVPPPADTGDQ